MAGLARAPVFLWGALGCGCLWGPRPYLLKRSEDAAAGKFSGHRETAPDRAQREPALGESWGLAPVLLEGSAACWTARGLLPLGRISAPSPRSSAGMHAAPMPTARALGGVVLSGPVETGVPGGPRGLALPGHPGRLAAPSLELQASVSLLDSRPLLPARPPAQAPHRASVAARGLALCSTRPPSLADPSAGPLGSSSAALGTPVSLHLSASPGPALGAFPRPDTPLLCHLDTASCSTPTCGLLPLKPRQISIAATLCLQRP